jgi:hypothetical protein
VVVWADCVLFSGHWLLAESLVADGTLGGAVHETYFKILDAVGTYAILVSQKLNFCLHKTPNFE